ncbi:FkbM family methyltransferase [Candidatus Bathyarchaeota archaeon]|nr:MAG: FkbM family methyltransferase [Candidatus Bathyarchaeota archaeon]
MFTVLRRAPKLAPFWALSKFYSLLGMPVTMNSLTRIIPHELYDVRKVGGISFGVRLSNPEDYQIVYGQQERMFLGLKPSPGEFVLDIGAHIGSYTLRYSRLVGDEGTVLAFEPEPDNRRILRWNVQLNGVQNVVIRPEALGDFHGKSRLRLSVYGGVHSFVRTSQEIRQIGEAFVPMIRLDELNLDRVDMIKIDVEGYEMEVLKGGEKMIRRFKPKMQIEVHRPHRSDCETCNWLKHLGFLPATTFDSGGAHWIQIS